jgi:hypothetical protein
MASIGNFDATTVDPNKANDPIPSGWYNVSITQSEVKATKDQTGAYLELGMKVMDGEHAGRMVFDRLNLHNKNPVAVEIAYRTLSAICHATGVMQVQDSQQLHGIPLQAKVVATPPKDGYDAGNDVKGYRSASEGQASGGAPQAAQGFQPPAQGFTPPNAPQGNGPPAQGFTPPNAQPAQQAQGFTPPQQQAPAQPQQGQQPNTFSPPQQEQAPAQNEQQGSPTTPPWAR